MITIRLDSPISLVEQIAAGIRAAIATGSLSPGDPLPTVRQLAVDLGVNQNTVSRAYRDLESAGLVSTVRGRGTEVTSRSEGAQQPKSVARTAIAQRLHAVFADARLAGLSEQEVREVIDQQMQPFWSKEGN